jgi:hypothetical protein
MVTIKSASLLAGWGAPGLVKMASTPALLEGKHSEMMASWLTAGCRVMMDSTRQRIIARVMREMLREQSAEPGAKKWYSRPAMVAQPAGTEVHRDPKRRVNTSGAISNASCHTITSSPAGQAIPAFRFAIRLLQTSKFAAHWLYPPAYAATVTASRAWK